MRNRSSSSTAAYWPACSGAAIFWDSGSSYWIKLVPGLAGLIPYLVCATRERNGWTAPFPGSFLSVLARRSHHGTVLMKYGDDRSVAMGNLLILILMLMMMITMMSLYVGNSYSAWNSSEKSGFCSCSSLS